MQNVGRELIDHWIKVAKDRAAKQATLHYAREKKGAGHARLLWEFLNPEVDNLDASARRFRVNRSMREVEASADVLVERLSKPKRPS